MKHRYPTPQEVGIAPPKSLKHDLFNAGFDHAMRGGNLTHRDHLKLSFRQGFRAAKLYLRELRKTQGVYQFPLQGKIRMKTA